MLVLVAAAVLPLAAGAQDESEARARVLYQEAEDLYAEGDFQGAIARLREAYRLTARPLLQYNLANAYEAAGEHLVAAEHLRRYLRHARPDEVADVEARIARLESLPARAATEDGAASGETGDAAGDRSRAAPDASGGSPLPTIGWLTVGAGGVLLALGGVFAGLASSARSDVTELCRSDYCLESAQGAINRDASFSLAADLSWAVGLAAVATGLVLALVGGDDEAAVDGPTAAVALGPTGASAWLRERF
jgi:tetratricopeptide (TPR) repeat protein